MSAINTLNNMSDLLQAVMDMDLKTVSDIIERNPEKVNEVGPHGWTALHVVAMTCYLNRISYKKVLVCDAICKLLLANGANHLAKDERNNTPMTSSFGFAPVSLRDKAAQYQKANPEPDNCAVTDEDGITKIKRGAHSRIIKYNTSTEWMDMKDLGRNIAA